MSSATQQQNIKRAPFQDVLPVIAQHLRQCLQRSWGRIKIVEDCDGRLYFLFYRSARLITEKLIPEMRERWREVLKLKDPQKFCSELLGCDISGRDAHRLLYDAVWMVNDMSYYQETVAEVRQQHGATPLSYCPWCQHYNRNEQRCRRNC